MGIPRHDWAAKHHWLGQPLPNQLTNRTQAHQTALSSFLQDLAWTDARALSGLWTRTTVGIYSSGSPVERNHFLTRKGKEKRDPPRIKTFFLFEKRSFFSYEIDSFEKRSFFSYEIDSFEKRSFFSYEIDSLWEECNNSTIYIFDFQQLIFLSFCSILLLKLLSFQIDSLLIRIKRSIRPFVKSVLWLNKNTYLLNLIITFVMNLLIWFTLTFGALFQLKPQNRRFSIFLNHSGWSFKGYLGLSSQKSKRVSSRRGMEKYSNSYYLIFRSRPSATRIRFNHLPRSERDSSKSSFPRSDRCIQSRATSPLRFFWVSHR